MIHDVLPYILLTVQLRVIVFHVRCAAYSLSMFMLRKLSKEKLWINRVTHFTASQIQYFSSNSRPTRNVLVGRSGPCLLGVAQVSKINSKLENIFLSSIELVTYRKKSSWNENVLFLRKFCTILIRFVADSSRRIVCFVFSALIIAWFAKLVHVTTHEGYFVVSDEQRSERYFVDWSNAVYAHNV